MVSGKNNNEPREIVKWTATTESGAIYEYDRGIVTITPGPASSRWPTTFMVWTMMSAPEEEGMLLPWQYPGYKDAFTGTDGVTGSGPWKWVRLPVVGERLLVAGRDEWRVSTKVAQLDMEYIYESEGRTT